MKRRLALNVLTACSIGVFVLAGMCWASGVKWSPYSPMSETRPVTSPGYRVAVFDGMLVFSRNRPLDGPPPADPTDLPSSLVLKAGFGYGSAPLIAPGSTNAVIGLGAWVFVPMWFFMVLAAALPVGWLVKHLRAKLVIPPGHCPSCGYDLRASPQQCPECGALKGA